MNTFHKKPKASPQQKQKGQPTSKFIEHDHLDKIGEIALYYGFNPAKSPDIKKTDLDLAKSLLEGDFIEDDYDHTRLPLHVEEKIALLRMYAEKNMHNHAQPVMFYFKEPFKGAIKKGSPFNRYCDLEIIGNSKSIAEATLIQTARMILKEEGYENICVEINSIGDKDSLAKFTRDLTAYYRKNINDMHAECRQLLKKDPFALLSCQDERCKKVNDSAPKSINFLSETSRVHFKEILEYLEALDIPYRINNNLIGNRKYCTETMFTILNLDEIKDIKKGKEHEHKILAVGVRYDGLSKKISLKKEIQGAGVSILIKNNRPELRKEVKKTRRPWISFVQLGFDSKLLSLQIIEMLRHEKIPVYQSLSRDRLGAQVSMAEKYKITHTIIMGQKEAMEKSLIIRNTETHAQETVALEALAKFMRKLDL
jgi:histidyl-tRNA synthetase